MIIDAIVVVFAITSLYRGREIGFVRQLCSTVGFFGGLFLGAWLEPHLVGFVHSQASRSVLTVIITLGCALILLTIGEYFGLRLKRHVLQRRINVLDNSFGAVLGMVSSLLSIWLIAAVIAALPTPGLQAGLRDSRIITQLNKILPEAPSVIASLGHLIDPNSFPQVFVGNEPSPRGGVKLPSLGDLQTAVDRDKASVVKLEGQGCGGVVEGSGFVVGPGLVATNAHVVAGIHQPYVIDSNGTHRGTVIWFDPNLDFAVLRVSNLAGSTLVISASHVTPGTAAAVLGYPGGGSFTASTAAVLDEFTASGRNIYDSGTTTRAVYEIRATVIPGNSGGPLVDKDGSVIGVVFAESTTYQHAGYALTTAQVTSEINQAAAQNQPVSTGRCAQ